MLSRILARAATPVSEVSPGQVLDSLDTAVIVINEQGEILAANPYWYSLCDDRGNTLFHEYLHPGDRALWQQALLQAPHSVRLRLLPSDNPGSLWCELRTNPVTPGQSWPISITLIDISGQIDQSRQREADWRSLSQLVEQLPAMLYRGRNNRDWSMEYVSAGCLQLTGYPPEVLTHQSCLNYGDLIHPEDAGNVWDQVQDALSRHQPFSLNYRLQHADGRLLPVHEQGCGLYAANGAVLGVEGLVIQRH